MTSELLRLMGIVLVLWFGIMIVYLIWHYRNKKMREYRRRREYYKDGMSPKLELDILPEMTKDELKVLAEKEKSIREKSGGDVLIDLNNYDGLPLKPKVYFDEQDAGAEDQPKPKIKRSFLSNEPIPKDFPPSE